MYKLQKTKYFDQWLTRLKDRQARARIAQRLESISLGNLGDSKSLGAELSEFRFHYGPGYRVYYTIIGEQIILLLVGGNKNTQDKDIRKAKEMVLILKGENDE